MLKIPDLTLTEECVDAASDPYLRQLGKFRPRNEGSDARAGLCESLAEDARANAATNLMKEGVFHQVVRQLTSRGIDTIAPYKGMYLLLTLYRECPWIRPMGDVDVIVRRADYARVRDVLREIGEVYPHFPGRPLLSAVNHEFSAVIRGVHFDVHRGFTPLRVFQLDTDALLDGAVTVSSLEDTHLSLMSLAYATALQIFHDLSAGLSGPACLTWERLSQVYVMIHNAGISEVREACGDLGIDRFLGVYVFLLETMFANMAFSSAGLSVPDCARGLVRGSRTPFEYSRGEFLFKAHMFRGARVRKLLPRLLGPADTVAHVLGLGVRAFARLAPRRL